MSEIKLEVFNIGQLEDLRRKIDSQIEYMKSPFSHLPRSIDDEEIKLKALGVPAMYFDAIMSLSKLIVLRDKWREDVRVKPRTRHSIRYGVVYDGHKICVLPSSQSPTISFDDKAKAEAFLATFKEQIEQAKHLL